MLCARIHGSALVEVIVNLHGLQTHLIGADNDFAVKDLLEIGSQWVVISAAPSTKETKIYNLHRK